MTEEIVLRSQQPKQLTRYQRAGTFSKALLRLRRPLIDISSRRIQEGVASEKDFRRMLKSNDPGQIASALVASIPRETGEVGYRDAGRDAIVRSEELQKDLAKRLVNSGRFTIPKIKSFIRVSVAGLGLVGAYYGAPIEVALTLIMGSECIFECGSGKPNPKYRENLAQETSRLLNMDLPDGVKAILVPHAKKDDLRALLPNATGQFGEFVNSVLNRREADEAFNRLMDEDLIPSEEQDALVKTVCEKGSGLQAGDLSRSRKITSPGAKQMLDGQLYLLWSCQSQ